MSIFDFNCALGRAASPVGGAFDTTDALLSEMRRLGIDQALVYHRLAAEADVDRGNRLLLEMLDGCEALHPAWVLAPSTLGDLPAAEAWVREAVDLGVCAFRMMPMHSLYSLRDATSGPQLAAVAGAGLPLLLDYGLHHWSKQVIPWHEIGEACSTYPKLNFVVTGVTVGESRDLVGLLRRHGNLHVEMHAFLVPRAYVLFKRDGLERQVLFGTNMPVCAGECALGQLLLGGLSEVESGVCAWENALRLIAPALGAGGAEGVLSALDPPNPLSKGSFRDEETTRAIDVHCHYGAWERTITPIRGVQAYLDAMDAAGIEAIVGSSFSAIHGEMRLGNAESAAFVKQAPERLFAYCAVNPHYPDEIAAELRHCFEEADNFVGFKFHCYLHQVQLQDPGYEPALTYANDNGLPVLVHGGGSDTWEATCGRYPNAKFIMAHACLWDGFDPAGRALYGFARTLPNLYVDVCGSGAYRGSMRALIDLIGAEKILYGSDFPMFDFGFELGRITLAELSSSEKSAICRKNAHGIFGTHRRA